MRGSLSTTNARAEPEPQSSVGLGLSFGVLARVNGLALAGIDGTWRYGEATWLHLAAAGSVSFADYISSVLEVRAGLEHRRVRCGWGCLYGGIDLALLDADIHDGPGPASGHARGAVVAPRGGIDLGGDTVRFRLRIELLAGAVRVQRNLQDTTASMDTTATQLTTGFAMTAGLVMRL